MKRVIYFIFCFLLSSHLVMSQEDCSVQLKKAQSSYEQGVLEGVSKLLEGCLASDNFTKTEKVEAYKLKVLVSLFEDDFTGAESNMISLLKTDPDYVPKANDPIEIKDLYNKFRTDPVFTFGLKAGLNLSYATVLQYYSIGTTNDPTFNWADSYAGVGYQAALSYNHRLDKGLYINFDPSIIITNHTIDDVVGSDSTILIKQRETNMILNGNLGLSYDFKYKNPVKPFIEAGAMGSYFISSNTSPTLNYKDNSGLSVQESRINLLGGLNSTGEYTLVPNRPEYMISVYYGGGLKFKVGNGHFMFGVRHNLGLTNITLNKNNRELLYRYNYTLKDITLNSVVFNIGYLQSVYKPKILKRKLKNEK